jgi:outer membrane protein OmpA-like peptidoglycan-associated protein
MRKPTILIFLIFILSAEILHAETIKERSYSFRYDDGAEGMPDQTYLICNNCQDDRPTIIPNLVAHASAVAELPKNEPVSFDTNPREIAMHLVQSVPVAEKVHFNFDSAVLLPETTSILDRMQPKRGLRLAGFTCTIGTDNYNMALSQQRADAVSRYLKKRGISILTSIGYGKSTMYTDKSLNRRVEIIENKENNGP